MPKEMLELEMMSTSLLNEDETDSEEEEETSDETDLEEESDSEEMSSDEEWYILIV